MSHVTEITLDVKDPVFLKKAAQAMGLEVKEKDSYHWYGTHVGDYPLPTGFSKEDLGQCEFALAVPGQPNAYEVGVVKRRDGKEGYTFLFDFYGGQGAALETMIGHRGDRLINELPQEYGAQVAIHEMEQMGRYVERVGVDEDGQILLRGIKR